LNLLIDTHVLIWFAEANPKLLAHHAAVLHDKANDVYVSAVSIFEMAIKIRARRLVLPPIFMKSPMAIYNAFEFKPLPLTAVHSELAGQLAGDHNDPFDRMLAAQSIIDNLPIMTVDARIGEFGAKIIW
jgi:PIN domain nuclease of toxin-antitoxin system